MKFVTEEDLQKLVEAGRVSEDHTVIDVRLVSTDLALLTDPRFLLGACRFFNETRRAKRGKGPLCLGCYTEFSASIRPVDFLVVSGRAPHQELTGTVLLTGICRCCKRDNERLPALGHHYARAMFPSPYTSSNGSPAA